MSWQQWPGAAPVPQPGVVQASLINPAPNVVNPAAALVATGQYTPEQWAQMQQQNWQQWAQWQQQFQQWQQQYGAEYQKSITALAVQTTRPTPVQPPVPFFNMNTNAPPPLPAETKPPPPPDDPQQTVSANRTTFPEFTTAPPPISQANFTAAPPPQVQPTPPKDQFQNQLNPGGFPSRANSNETQQRFGNNQNYPPQNRGVNRNSNWQNQNNRNQQSFGDNRFNQPLAGDARNRGDFSGKRPFNQPNEGGDAKRNKLETNSEAGKWQGSQQNSKWDALPAQAENQRWNAAPAESPPKHNPEELTEAEKKFDKQFSDWEAQFQKWKEQNANHPDKEQYREYEKKWETWRSQLLDRREQMRRKRLGLTDESPQPAADKLAQAKSDNEKEKLPDISQSQSFPLNITAKPISSAVGAPTPVINIGKPGLLGPKPSDQFGRKPPLITNITSITLNRLPPIMNDQPLQFSKPPPGFGDKQQLENAPNDTEGFLKSAASAGIPGLDLVKDGKEGSKSDDESETQKKPDLEAISRGINSILGDQKLMNMLSMVSQNTNRPPPPINTTSTLNVQSPKFSPEPPQDDYSNQDNANWEPLNDTFSNMDEQTRSSFNVRNDAEEFDNFGKPDNFRGGGNDEFNRGPGSFNRGPNNFNADSGDWNRSNNLNRGTGEFNRGPEPFGRGFDSFNRGPDNSNRGPNNLRDSDNFRGPDHFNRASDSFNRGPDNSFRAPDNFTRGSDNFNRGPDNFNRANRGPDNYNRGPDNFARGADNFNRGPDHFNRGPDNFNRGPDNFRSANNFNRHSDAHANEGPDKFSGGPGFNREPPNLKDSSEDYSRGPQGFSRDRAADRGPNKFERNSDGFGRGSENFGRGSNEFNRGGLNRDGGPGHNNFNKDKEADNFRRGGDEAFKSFNQRPGVAHNFQENRFGGKPENFNRASRLSESFEEGSNSFDRPQDDSQNIERGNLSRANDAVVRFEPPPGVEWKSNALPNEAIPSLMQDTRDKTVVPEVEDIWKPSSVIDYDHKPLKSVDPDVIVEPVYSFDYRHKPLNRIPYPQRPKWLSDIVKNYPEFDMVIGRPFEQQQLRRYPLNERFDSRPAEVYQKYDDRSRKFYDDRERVPFNDRERDRERVAFDDRDRKPNDYRKSSHWERKSSDERGQRRFDDSDRRSDNTPRKSFDDRRSRDFGDRRSDNQNVHGDRKRSESFGRMENQHETSSSPRDKGQRKENEVMIEEGFNAKLVPVVPSKLNVTLIEDILNPPGRYNRPPRIVIILRGPPGSGKSFLAKLIKDREVEHGGSAPRILCLDDYFMVEQEKEVEEDGRKVKVKEMVYEFEECMEASYRQSLMKSFKKTITDGYFNFIIVDNINDKVKYFGEMWSFAKQNGFQVYISEMELDVQTCTKRNVHGRSEVEIERCVAGWEPTPAHHPILDATGLIQSGSISEVEMEEINSPPSENMNEEEHLISSKWDSFDYSVDNLAKLDGTNKPLRASKTMEDYLQLDDDWVQPVSTRPGQKRVRWADLEERKEQEKMRAIGFVVGQTNWDRMMDPTMGSGALTQTKYIERYS